MSARKPRTHPQIVAVELILAAAFAIAAYYLAKGTGHSLAVFAAGAASGLVLRLVTRHAGPKRKRGSARRPAGRQAAGRRS